MSVDMLFKYDVAIYDSIKDASAKARERDFDGAIEIMKNVLDKIWASNDRFTDDTYTKILPYFQKAGRYSEAIDFSENVLIPKLAKKHSPLMTTDRAFMCLYVSRIYGKLALNAKREKNLEDETFYKNLANEIYESYDELREKGAEEDLKSEYLYISELWGSDVSRWPSSLKERFKRSQSLD
jgi:hypothetical protein